MNIIERDRSYLQRMPDVPWKQMYAVRNILAHAYIKIDDKIVWDTVEKDIPQLASRLKEII